MQKSLLYTALGASLIGLFHGCGPSPPNLVVRPGEPYSLDAGVDYVFKNVLIHEGAVLEFEGEGHAEWTTLKITDDLWLKGTIRSIGFAPLADTNRVAMAEKMDDKTRADAVENWKYWKRFQDDDDVVWLHHEYGAIKKGGDGGAGGREAECAKNSCFRLDCLLGGSGVQTKGGKGGSGMTAAQLDSCSKRSSKQGCRECYLLIKKNSKANPDFIKDCNCKGNDELKSGKLSVGEGGEGGGVGKFGGLLYISVNGHFFSEGYVDVSGGKGEAGKDGDSNRFSGGGGGGGGPGGSGGAVYFRVKGGGIESSIGRAIVKGGAGGAGGKGGVPHPKDGHADLKGSDGETGSPGARGVSAPVDKKCMISTL